MEGVPTQIIDERLQRKLKKKRQKIEAELKKQYGIDLDDPKFKLTDYEVSDPRPSKRPFQDGSVLGHLLAPIMPGMTARQAIQMMGPL